MKHLSDVMKRSELTVVLVMHLGNTLQTGLDASDGRTALRVSYHAPQLSRNSDPKEHKGRNSG